MATRMAPYNFPTNNSVNGYGLTFSDYNYSATLTADTEQNFTVPDYSTIGGSTVYSKNSYIAIFTFSGDAPVFVANNNTAALPSGTFATSPSQQLKSGDARYVFAGDVLSFISSEASDVCVMFYTQR